MSSGAFAVGACLTIDYPYTMSVFVGGALGCFLVGCFFLYKANKQASGAIDKQDIEPSGTTDDPQVTKVLISSPDSAENSYTY